MGDDEEVEDGATRTVTSEPNILMQSKKWIDQVLWEAVYILCK